MLTFLSVRLRLRGDNDIMEGLRVNVKVKVKSER